MTNIANL